MNTTYLEALANAYSFTARLGAFFERLPQMNTTLFTSEAGDRVHAAIAALGVDSFSGSVGQCIKWSHALRPCAESALGVPILLTFGQVLTPKQAFFNPSWDDLLNWYRNGFRAADIEGRSGINLHAWWTLPSGEVMDVTLWSTLSAVWKNPRMLGAMTGGWPDEIAPNPIYVPMVVGDDYIETIERRMPFARFLARACTPVELNALPVIGVWER